MSRAPERFSYVQIDRFGELFVRLRIRQFFKLSFAQFLVEPDYWIRAAETRLRYWRTHPRRFAPTHRTITLN